MGATTMGIAFDDVPAGVRVAGYSTESPPRTAGPGGEENVAGEGGGRGSWWYFWTWLVTPHVEFGAIYVGMVVVLFLDMSVLQALIGIVGGVAVGAFTHGLLTARGVQLRVPQIVLSRETFGARGNLIVTAVMAIVCSLGWFTFNSIVAALALNALFGLPTLGGLAIVVVVQLAISAVGLKLDVTFKAIQRYVFPLLTILLIIGGIICFVDLDPGKAPGSTWNLNGLVAIVIVGCLAWAYTIGWNPYATDYSDYHPTVASPKAAGLCSAAGLFLATTFLMAVGVAAGVMVDVGRDTNPTEQFTSILPGWLGVLILLGFIVSCWTNNLVTLKSIRHVFKLGEKYSPQAGEWLAPIIWTVAAFFIGWAALADLPANFEGFVMVVGYLIAPWLNVTLVDGFIKRRADPTAHLYDTSMSEKWAMFSVGFAIIGAVCLYTLQIFDGGRLPHGHIAYAALGMIGGFYLAAVIYGIGLKRMLKGHDELPGKQAHERRRRG